MLLLRLSITLLFMLPHLAYAQGWTPTQSILNEQMRQEEELQQQNQKLEKQQQEINLQNQRMNERLEQQEEDLRQQNELQRHGQWADQQIQELERKMEFRRYKEELDESREASMRAQKVIELSKQSDLVLKDSFFEEWKASLRTQGFSDAQVSDLNNAYKLYFYRMENLARSGNPEEQRKLAEEYTTGRAIVFNRDLAYEWFKKAAAGGDKKAQGVLRILKSLSEDGNTSKSSD